MPCIIVTGTNTGIGKTFVACGIARELRGREVDVGVFKPFCSGSREDAELLIEASGCGDDIDDVNPFHFDLPLAPFRAAQLEEKPVDIRACLAAFDIVRQRHDILIVEGAGGLMVPITETPDGFYSFRDLFTDLAGDIVIVAGRELGTINHSWLTADTCRQAGLTVLGFVFNDVRPVAEGEPAASNPRLVERCTGTPVLGCVRHNDKQPLWNDIVDGIMKRIDEQRG